MAFKEIEGGRMITFRIGIDHGTLKVGMLVSLLVLNHDDVT